MGPKTPCPHPIHLRMFVRAPAHAREADSVRLHLDQCDTCRAIASGFAAENSVQQTLADVDPAPPRPPNRARDPSGAADSLIAGAEVQHTLGDENFRLPGPPIRSQEVREKVAGATAANLQRTLGDQDLPPTRPVTRRQDPGDTITFLEADPGVRNTLADHDASAVLPPTRRPPAGSEGLRSQTRGSAEPTIEMSVDSPPEAVAGESDFELSDAPGSTLTRRQQNDPVQTCEFAPDEDSSRPGSSESAVARTLVNTGRGLPSRPGTLEGVTVPGYDILEELGRGGMGVVYKARHRRLQRLVALKMVLAGAHVGAGRPGAVSRRGGSRRQAASSQHRADLRDRRARRPAVLFARVRRGRQPRPADAQEPDESARGRPVRRDAGAHDGGGPPARHRPSRPQTGEYSPGQARAASRRWSGAGKSIRRRCPRITGRGPPCPRSPISVWPSGRTTIPARPQSGAILGTPSYMAPEQAGGKNREIGPAVDIYALGAILYELLVGRPPFKAGNPIDTVRQVIEQEPVPPRQLEPRVPYDLETICLKCLEKDPARRFATAAELADDLRRFVDGDPILARPTPAWERAWKWGKRRPAIVALLAVITAGGRGHGAVRRLAQCLVARQAGRGPGGRTTGPAARARRAPGTASVARARKRGRSCSTVPGSPWPPAIGRAARLDLEKALTTIGSEPRLEALRGARRRALETGRARAARRGRPAGVAGPLPAVRRQLRDEAQFLGTLYTGMDLAANLEAARTSVHQALAVYSVLSAGDARPRLDAYLSDAQKAEILGDCYQLLLILAETEAQSRRLGRKPAEKGTIPAQGPEFPRTGPAARDALPGFSPAAGTLPRTCSAIAAAGRAGRESGPGARPGPGSRSLPDGG